MNKAIKTIETQIEYLTEEFFKGDGTRTDSVMASIIYKLKQALAELRAEPRIDACVLAFAKRMQYKLNKNKHKECETMNPNGKGRGWSHCKTTWLRSRIRDEWYELGRALSKDDSDNILNECADIANFAMMIFDNVSQSKELDKRKE